MATFNGEAYLREMLQSLVMQKRPADLVIAVDDGSSDSTVQILDSFKEKLPLQIFKSPENKGHLAAFTKALELARGQISENDYIALADQDDVWLPEKLLQLEAAMEQFRQNSEKPLLIFGDAQVIDKEGNLLADSWRRLANIPTELSFKARIAGTNNITGCLSIFDAKLLDMILPIPQSKMVHDAWIGIVAEKMGKVISIPDPLIQYRLHDSNAVGAGVHYSYKETTERQICNVSAILNQASRLHLDASEEMFLKTFKCYLEARENHFLLISYGPWLWNNRANLFPTKQGQIKKVLFSLLGAKAVIALFGKNK